MVIPALKAAVDELSDADRRDLLHYLEQTVEDDFRLTPGQVAELERRDAQMREGAVVPLTTDQLMQKVRSRIQ